MMTLTSYLALLLATTLVAGSAWGASYQQIGGAIVDPIQLVNGGGDHPYNGPDLEPGVSLQNIDVSNADLTLADLSGANLTQANLSGADLSGAKAGGRISPTSRRSSCWTRGSASARRPRSAGKMSAGREGATHPPEPLAREAPRGPEERS